MPLPALTNLQCLRCGREGLKTVYDCGCWENCPCGYLKAKSEKCSNPKCFADVVADTTEMYWRVDDYSRKAYKSGSCNKTAIQRAIAVTGNHFKSLKDARAAAKLDPSEWLAFRVKLYGEPEREGK
jgi:hypothetical protein